MPVAVDMAGVGAAGAAGARECAVHHAHAREVSWVAPWGKVGQAWPTPDQAAYGETDPCGGRSPQPGTRADIGVLVSRRYAPCSGFSRDAASAPCARRGLIYEFDPLSHATLQSGS
jgi:hypothetical protein